MNLTPLGRKSPNERPASNQNCGRPPTRGEIVLGKMVSWGVLNGVGNNAGLQRDVLLQVVQRRGTHMWGAIERWGCSKQCTRHKRKAKKEMAADQRKYFRGERG